MLVEKGSSLDIIFKEEAEDDESAPISQAKSTSLINECVRMENMILFRDEGSGDDQTRRNPRGFKPPKAGNIYFNYFKILRNTISFLI